MKMTLLFLGDSITAGSLGASYVNRLMRKMPQHKYINQGKSGDTVASLYRRLKKLRFDESVDLAVLWIGVNDIFVKLSPSFRITKLLAGQRWSKNSDRFKQAYHQILDITTSIAPTVLSLPPLLIGEDPLNPWNRKLGILAGICRRLSEEVPGVRFLDIRKSILDTLKQGAVSEYLPNRMKTISVDVITLTDDEKVNRKASERGLRFTVDGVHLNTAGAEFIADELYKEIMEIQRIRPED